MRILAVIFFAIIGSSFGVFIADNGCERNYSEVFKGIMMFIIIVLLLMILKEVS
ncbi:hypothetical protein ACWOBH_05425 [Globicatella sanguinis]